VLHCDDLNSVFENAIHDHIGKSLDQHRPCSMKMLRASFGTSGDAGDRNL